MTRIRLKVSGERIGAECGTGRWTLYRIGGDGKCSDSRSVIPPFVAPDELEQHLFELLYESAKPGHSTIRRLADP